MAFEKCSCGQGYPMKGRKGTLHVTRRHSLTSVMTNASVLRRRTLNSWSVLISGHKLLVYRFSRIVTSILAFCFSVQLHNLLRDYIKARLTIFFLGFVSGNIAYSPLAFLVPCLVIFSLGFTSGKYASLRPQLRVAWCSQIYLTLRPVNT